MTAPRAGRVLTLAAECEVPCESCGAVADAVCVTKDGRPNRNPHNARRRAWQKAVALRDLDTVTAQAEAQARAIPGDVAAGTSNVGIAVDSAGTAHPRPEAVPAEEFPDETPDEELSDREIVTRLLVLKVLEARVAELKGDLREAGARALRVGDNMAGYLDGDDRALGRVGLSKPSQTWKVVDVDVLTAWVEVHAPSEIERRPVIRNSFLAPLMAGCKTHKGHWLNPATGELVEIDGVELSTGTPTLTVKASEDAEAIVSAAIAAGRLGLDGLPALPAGQAGAA